MRKVLAAVACTLAAALSGCITASWPAGSLSIDGFHTCTSGKDQQQTGLDRTKYRCALAGEELRFRFDVVDADVCTVPAEEIKHPLDIAGGDRVEVYFVPDAEMKKPYHCVEIDADGRVLSYFVDEKKHFDWFWKFATLKVKTGRTKEGYFVEGSVSRAELESFGIDLRSFHMGVFRAEMSAPGKVGRWCSAAPIRLPAHFHQPAMMFPVSLCK